MKHSRKTRATALMFSAAAIGAGMLATGCRGRGYSVYGPPPDSELDDTVEITEILAPETTEPAETSAAAADFDAPIDLDSLTDADFRSMSNEMLAAIGKQYAWLPKPAFCGELSAGFPDRPAMSAKAVETQEEAYRLVCEEFRLEPEGLFSERSGCYWLYTAGSGIAYYYIVPDRAFFDPETQTLNAEVTEENMLLLAAMRNIPGKRRLGAFVTDEGDRLICKEYDLLYSGGDYGMSDTVTLYGFSFSAEKATGKLTDYQSDRYGFSRTVAVPDTYHPYPDESAKGAV